MINTSWDIFGLGAAAVDDLWFVEHYPQPDEKVRVHDLQRHGGGLTATALVAAARQGCRTLYCGVLGFDELSEYVLAEYHREGVDYSAVVRQSDARPFHSCIIVDSSSGSRTILSYPQGVRPPPVEQIRPEWIQQSKVVFSDHTAGASGLAAARLAHQFGVPVVLDMESLAAPEREALVACADHLIVGQAFARGVTGESEPEAMLRVLAGERTACVVTAGERGCWFVERGGGVQYFPAFQVKVVDTTGCGDVFHGAYAAAIARGEPVAMAVAVATATAGLKATRPGGREGIPSLEQVRHFLFRR